MDQSTPSGSSRKRPSPGSPKQHAPQRRREDSEWIVREGSGSGSTQNLDKQSGVPSVWELSLDVWDLEDRPPSMQDPRYRYPVHKKKKKYLTNFEILGPKGHYKKKIVKHKLKLLTISDINIFWYPIYTN